MKVILLTDQFIHNKDTFIVGGWIQSLIGVLQASPIIELAVIGQTEENSCIEKENNTTFYKICCRKSPNPFSRIYQRFRCKIQDKRVINDYLHAIQNFNPDIIHIFGTESFLCNIIPLVESKVVVHLQGLINPYLNAWLPSGISRSLFDFYSFDLLDSLKGMGSQIRYKHFRKMAQREQNYFNSISYVMGRTTWDKLLAETLGNNIKYFHQEEVLRSDFYTENQWNIKKREPFQLISVLSPNSYKGFDMILKTACLLKSKGIKFQWSICGTSENNSTIKAMEKIFKKKYKSHNVSFRGRKTAKELVEFLLDSDLFIHPSYIENSPNSICEAQILGLPVCATYTGGIPSLVEDNKTGMLFPANDPYCLTGIITTLLSDSQKMANLGNNARKAALKRHNKETILENIENIYQQILQSQ